MKQSALEKIYKHLIKNPKKSDIAYYVPSLWSDFIADSKPIKTNFNTYFTELLSGILDQKSNDVDYRKSLSSIHQIQTGIGGDWTYTSQVYNMFPRLTTAFDHDNDGHIGNHKTDTTLNKKGNIRETGTFLKVIAMLPYIKSLGCNVLYFLPLTAIGKDGNRGDLGSPYAIKNQYQLDQNLVDPLLPFSAEEQFNAVVEAAHILGIRVVMEFVLRTNSLDGDWVKENPDWFYWIDKNRAHEYQSPYFPEHELTEIKKIPYGSGYHFAPNDEYRSLFKKPPKPNEISVENGKYIAKTEEGELIIPGAFADWPPDDIQPAWSDVTYLRMYNYDYQAPNNYNYIAYNTIRYYDPELAKDDNINRALWDKLAGVIPYYQEQFGIDGVMMDMGHAVPKKLMAEIISKARSFDSDFAFMEENFEIEWSSRQAGYNGTLGFEWRTTGLRQGGIKDVIHITQQKLGLPFFGTPETHNTPRAMQRGGEMHSKQIWAINNLLPNCIPFIHSGFELFEDYPINTGLNFSPTESEFYSKHHLGLFYKNAYNWNREHTMIPFINHIRNFREKHAEMLVNGNEQSIRIHYPETKFGHVIAFERFKPEEPHQSILCIANTNYHSQETFYLNVFGTYSNVYSDYLTGNSHGFVDHWLSATLEAGQVVILELHKLV